MDLDDQSRGLFFFMVTLGFIAFLFFWMWLERRAARKRDQQQKVSIFIYLQQFDVEDIDLRKSPPGGWHGTYMHKLAYGINKANRRGDPHYDVVEDDNYSATGRKLLTAHSSTARDSVFMDIHPSSSPSYRDRVEPEPLLGYDEMNSNSNSQSNNSSGEMRIII